MSLGIAFYCYSFCYAILTMRKIEYIELTLHTLTGIQKLCVRFCKVVQSQFVINV